MTAREPASRKRYRFVGRCGGLYLWHRTLVGDSRVEQMSCRVDWFWGGVVKQT